MFKAINRLEAIKSQVQTRQLTTPSINHITVIGAGLMGSGVVQVTAQAGYKVTMVSSVNKVDQSEQALENGRSIISKSLARVAKKLYTDDKTKQSKFIDDVFLNISTSTNAIAAVKANQTDLVIEAILENLAIKQRLFKDLDVAAKQSTIFTSNTSSLPITQIASSTTRQSNFAGLHFFNPVPQMSLVEIVKTTRTLPQVISTLESFVKSLGKVSVACSDTPGFIVNRLLVPYILDGIRMVERGDASKEDVDTAMKLGAGYPMGPFELADYVGLDTIQFITSGWYESGVGLKGDKIVAPSKMLDELVGQGKLGRKSGHGFYNYKK